MIVPADTAEALARHWGKAAPEEAEHGPAHHTVLGHSLDVAACAFVLLQRHLVLRKRISQASELAEATLACTLAAICCLHDLGKFDARFARKAPLVADVLRPDTVDLVIRRYDHGTEGFRQLERDNRACTQFLDLFGEACLPLLRAVTGHHGNLPTADDPDPSRALLPRSIVREDIAARAAFVELVAEFFRSLGAQLPWPGPVDGAMVQRVAGLAAVADWVGSDVQYFPYRPGPIENVASYWQESVARAERACAGAGLLRAALGAPTFATLFPGFAPRDVQILTEKVTGEVPALIIVEAEMGKGKTEAALALAARFLRHSHGEGITFALPTMATSNAMFERVDEVVTRLYPDADVQLALAHSRASRQPRFSSLVQRGLKARDLDAAEATVSCARWLLNKKRILLAQVGVGTIDQALQAALTVKHQFVRLFGLSRNVVIIDEVHAYDAYMEVLLEHLLSWLGALRVSVILLSATLPSQRRAALAAAWQASDPHAAYVSGERAAAQPYPLVTVATAQGTDSLAGVVDGISREVRLERIERGADSSHLAKTAARLISAAKAGARVAWIRNTVSEAQSAYQAILDAEADVEHVLFHARFRGVDRSRIEAHVLEHFGKRASAGGRILIATQVVEQSLDLDFDELHSDIAPIDLLFQRTGRLHRHDRARPPGFETPRLCVHVPDDEDREALRYGPSHYVYDVPTLWLSDQHVRRRQTFLLPNDIRPLVEATYHSELRLASLREGPARLLELEAKLEDKLESKRVAARRCCIAPSNVDQDGATVMDDDDEAVRAFTRDGTSYTVLPLLWDGLDGWTLASGENESKHWHLDAASPSAWRLVHELMDQTLSTFAPLKATVPPGQRDAWASFDRLFARFAADTHLGAHVALLPLRRHGAAFVGAALRDGRAQVVHYSLQLGLRILPLESTP